MTGDRGDRQDPGHGEASHVVGRYGEEPGPIGPGSSHRRTRGSAAAASFAQLGAGPGITEDTVLYEIRRQLHRCGTAEEMVVCVRGCQAAAHRAGWLVSAVLS